MTPNAFGADLRWCEGTVMHPSTHAALALLLLSAQPVQAQAPLPPGFVDAAAVVDGMIVDMRYFGANNFVGERIDGYERPRCLLSEPAARALAAVERDLSARGLGLKVFDCYRPQRASAIWARRSTSSARNHGCRIGASAIRRSRTARCSPPRCAAAAFGPTTRSGGTSRSTTSRSRIRISISR